MKRDKKGRFSKEEDDKEGFNLNITLLSFKNILFWLILLILLLLDGNFCKIQNF